MTHLLRALLRPLVQDLVAEELQARSADEQQRQLTETRLAITTNNRQIERDLKRLGVLQQPSLRVGFTNEEEGW